MDQFGGDIQPGTLMSLVPLKGDSKNAAGGYGSISKQPLEHLDNNRAVSGTHNDHDAGIGHAYIFVAKDMSKEMKARHPEVEVHVAKHIADAFFMKKGTQALLRPVSHAVGITPPWFR